MNYPKLPAHGKLIENVALYAQLKHEYGAKGIARALAETEQALKECLKKLERIPIDKNLSKRRAE